MKSQTDKNEVICWSLPSLLFQATSKVLFCLTWAMTTLAMCNVSMIKCGDKDGVVGVVLH